MPSCIRSQYLPTMIEQTTYKTCTSVNHRPVASLTAVYETRRPEVRSGAHPHPIIFFRLLVNVNQTLPSIQLEAIYQQQLNRDQPSTPHTCGCNGTVEQVSVSSIRVNLTSLFCRESSDLVCICVLKVTTSGCGRAPREELLHCKKLAKLQSVRHTQ